MQVNLLLSIVVLLIAVLQNPTKAVQQRRPVVEVSCGGDDNLTQGVCLSAYKQFESSPDFTLSSEESRATLIVTIPTNVDWKEYGKRTRVIYTVKFTSTNGKKLGTKKGKCWEDDIRTCATQIVRQAKLAASKLTADP
jgi:hypothetical protein